MIKPIYHQVNCREQNKVDLRQAKAVLKYKPDIIIFELPEKNNSPETVFNKYNCRQKPVVKIKLIKKNLKKSAKQFGYALSDIKVWENIEYLWQQEKNVLLYNIDGPTELRQEFFEVWQNMYPSAKKNWLWWVSIYLRDRIMANHLQSILKKYKFQKNPVILIFLQNFHWQHVKFLLKNPTSQEIWQYYFGKFSEINIKTISHRIKKNNKLFYRYWKKYSDF